METEPPRERLLRLIQQYPGLHTRDLARRARMSEALAAYHLALMVTEKQVEVSQDGMFRRYYVPGQRVAHEDKAWMALLRRPIVLHIGLYILQHGPATNGQLTHELGLVKSTVSYHVSTLIDAGFLKRVEGSEDQLALTDPQRIERILAKWVPTPDLTDRFTDLFGRFYSKRRS